MCAGDGWKGLDGRGWMEGDGWRGMDGKGMIRCVCARRGGTGQTRCATACEGCTLAILCVCLQGTEYVGRIRCLSVEQRNETKRNMAPRSFPQRRRSFHALRCDLRILVAWFPPM